MKNDARAEIHRRRQIYRERGKNTARPGGICHQLLQKRIPTMCRVSYLHAFKRGLQSTAALYSDQGIVPMIFSTITRLYISHILRIFHLFILHSNKKKKNPHFSIKKCITRLSLLPHTSNIVSCKCFLYRHRTSIITSDVSDTWYLLVYQNISLLIPLVSPIHRCAESKVPRSLTHSHLYIPIREAQGTRVGAKVSNHESHGARNVYKLLPSRARSSARYLQAEIQRESLRRECVGDLLFHLPSRRTTCLYAKADLLGWNAVSVARRLIGRAFSTRRVKRVYGIEYVIRVNCFSGMDLEKGFQLVARRSDRSLAFT